MQLYYETKKTRKHMEVLLKNNRTKVNEKRIQYQNFSFRMRN